LTRDFVIDFELYYLAELNQKKFHQGLKHLMELVLVKRFDSLDRFLKFKNIFYVGS